MKKIYHFLGSITFAVFLIGSTALFVIAGTVLESVTDSHRYAATFTYSNPIFIALLGLYFVNILLSALRRWPFKKRHVPFLITHLGLLMILTGCIIKSFWGVQGVMTLSEGSGSQDIFLPHTKVVQVQSRGRTGYFEKTSPFPELEIKPINYCPNSCERIESWIKKDHVVISGLPPFPLDEIHVAQLFPKPYPPSKVLGSRTKKARSVYLNGLKIKISELYEGPFDENIRWDGGYAETTLDFEEASLKVSIHHKDQRSQIEIPLTGPDALSNKNTLTPQLGSGPFAVELEREPLLFIEEESLTHFGKYGDIQRYPVKNDTVIAYDNGFGGYSTKAEFVRAKRRTDIEKEKIKILREEIQKGVDTNPTLAPPLQLLYDACQKEGVDFIDTCLDFLIAWENNHSWLYPIDAVEPPVMKQLDWENVPTQIRRGCYWTHSLFREIEPALQRGVDPITALSDIGCPSDDLTTITEQIFAAGDLFPDIPTKTLNARLLSAYFRAYGIHLRTITPQITNQTDPIVLESPLTFVHEEIPPLRKLEDNLPKITVKVKQGKQVEFVTLAYHPAGGGLAWPVLNGSYLLRYQPKKIGIPYRVRLRQARQINYANSAQPYSFEAEILIKDAKTGKMTEKTISMNNVYETWDGYRFYLSNINPPNETAVKRVQLAVNYDPAKYLLTYPGGLIVALGAILLFWFRTLKGSASS